LPSRAEDIFGRFIPTAAELLFYGIGIGIDLTVLPPRLRRTDNGRAAPGACEILASIVQAVGPTMQYAGVKRAAFMATLRISHPDVFDFIMLKRARRLEDVNTSLSVGLDERTALLNGGEVPVTYVVDGTPRRFTIADLEEMQKTATDRFVAPPTLSVSGSSVLWTYGSDDPHPVGCVDVFGAISFFGSAILRLAALAAHGCGDPGIVDLWVINRANPTPQCSGMDPVGVGIGELLTTTPCGEQPLLPGEMCHLGSINLAAHVRDGALLEDELRDTISVGVRMLDDIVTLTDGLSTSANDAIRANRKVGIGVMGLADLLVEMRIPYGTAEACRVIDEIFGLIASVAREASEVLANERGPFPNFSCSRWRMGRSRRNATLTTVAPTGHIAALAEVSPSIEPFFSLAYESRLGGRRLVVNPHLQRLLSACNFSLDLWVAESARRDRAFRFDGTLSSLCAAPTGDPERDTRIESIRCLLTTAHEVPARAHLAIVSTIQRHVDNGISKTINLCHDASVADIENIFRMALSLELKGITIYRDGCLEDQALASVSGCPSCGSLTTLEPSGCGGICCTPERGGCGFDSCKVAVPS
jgi:ribonucleoside-diphosphate reductase alpha chain